MLKRLEDLMARLARRSVEAMLARELEKIVREHHRKYTSIVHLDMDQFSRISERPTGAVRD